MGFYLQKDVSIVKVFYLVFSQLAVGGMAVMLLIPKGLIGANFHRLMGGIYLLVSGLARCANLYLNDQAITFLNFFRFWEDTESILVISFVCILLLYTLSWWIKSSLVTLILFYAGILSGIFWLIYSAIAYIEIVEIPGAAFLLPLQFIMAAVLLGTVHTGMWFGHWYLVTPELPVHYLRRFNTLLLGVLIVSIVLFCLSLYFRSQVEEADPFTFHRELIFFIRVGSWICWNTNSISHHMGLLTSKIC